MTCLGLIIRNQGVVEEGNMFVDIDELAEKLPTCISIKGKQYNLKVTKVSHTVWCAGYQEWGRVVAGYRTVLVSDVASKFNRDDCRSVPEA